MESLPKPYRIDVDKLDDLLSLLKKQGYNVIGPRVQNGAIIYEEISSTQDLPIGWKDEQSPASYKLTQGPDNSYFGFAVGPQSWKNFLFPPRLKLLNLKRNGESIVITREEGAVSKYAFFGVRPCEINAILLQDAVFLSNAYQDDAYKERRKDLFIVAVNCTRPAATCFCSSMQTGPKALKGFDIVLTEVQEDSRHYFLAEAGSERGLDLLNGVSPDSATDDEVQSAAEMIDLAQASMVRAIDTSDVKENLHNSADYPRWDAVARRCLACANCTMVCPTCFCFTTEDVADLSGGAERWRAWDSCFTAEFSYIHGGSIRSSPKSRYRQWVTHKFASWVDQFGAYGCVGCGRCITWCPVGIDITEEVKAISGEQIVQSIS